MNTINTEAMAKEFQMFSMFRNMMSASLEDSAGVPEPAQQIAPQPVLSPLANVRTNGDTTDTFIQTATGFGQMETTLAEISIIMLHDHKVFNCKDAESALQKLTDAVMQSASIPATGFVRGKEVNFRAAGKPDGKLTSKFSLASWDATNSIWQNWSRSLAIYFDEKGKTNHKTAYELLFTAKSYVVPVRSLSKMLKDRGLNQRTVSTKTAMQKADQRVAMVAPQIVELAKTCSKKASKDLLAVLELAIKEIKARK